MSQISILIIGLLYLVSTISIAASESGLGEHNSTNETNEDSMNTTATDNCTYTSPQWVEHLYNVHFHKDGVTHLHIGLNVSLKEAVHNDGLAFKQLLLKKHDHYLEPQGNCKAGNHLKHHAQLRNQACKWEYKCDYNPRRFPAHVFQAVCINQYWLGPYYKIRKCSEVYYPITTLHTAECNPVKSTTSWEWRMEMVAVACA